MATKFLKDQVEVEQQETSAFTKILSEVWSQAAKAESQQAFDFAYDEKYDAPLVDEPAQLYHTMPDGNTVTFTTTATPASQYFFYNTAATATAPGPTTGYTTTGYVQVGNVNWTLPSAAATAAVVGHNSGQITVNNGNIANNIPLRNVFSAVDYVEGSELMTWDKDNARFDVYMPQATKPLQVVKSVCPARGELTLTDGSVFTASFVMAPVVESSMGKASYYAFVVDVKRGTFDVHVIDTLEQIFELTKTL
jgi:hypothetical protein